MPPPEPALRTTRPGESGVSPPLTPRTRGRDMPGPGGRGPAFAADSMQRLIWDKGRGPVATAARGGKRGR